MWIPLLEQAQMSEKVANEDVSKFFFILDGQAGILASKTFKTHDNIENPMNNHETFEKP